MSQLVDGGPVFAVASIKAVGTHELSDTNGESIMVAARDGEVAVLEQLLRGASGDPDDLHTALFVASQIGHMAVVECLASNPRVGIAAGDNLALIAAAWNGHEDIVDRLLADPRVDPAAQHNLALRIAAHNGHALVVRRLLADARVDASDEDDLRLASPAPAPVVMRAMADEWGCRVMYVASADGQLPIVQRCCSEPMADPIDDTRSAAASSKLVAGALRLVPAQMAGRSETTQAIFYRLDDKPSWRKQLRILAARRARESAGDPEAVGAAAAHRLFQQRAAIAADGSGEHGALPFVQQLLSDRSSLAPLSARGVAVYLSPLGGHYATASALQHLLELRLPSDMLSMKLGPSSLPARSWKARLGDGRYADAMKLQFCAAWPERQRERFNDYQRRRDAAAGEPASEAYDKDSAASSSTRSYSEPDGDCNASASTDDNLLSWQLLHRANALQFAAASGHHRIVELLLSHATGDGSLQLNRALCAAVRNGHVSAVEQLLADERADPASHDNYCVYAAAQLEDTTLLQRLLRDHRIAPAASDNRAVRAAAADGNIPAVRMLLADDRLDATAAAHAATESASRSLVHNRELLRFLLRESSLSLPVWLSCVCTAALRENAASLGFVAGMASSYAVGSLASSAIRRACANSLSRAGVSPSAAAAFGAMQPPASGVAPPADALVIQRLRSIAAHWGIELSADPKAGTPIVRWQRFTSSGRAAAETAGSLSAVLPTRAAGQAAAAARSIALIVPPFSLARNLSTTGTFNLVIPLVAPMTTDAGIGMQIAAAATLL